MQVQDYEEWRDLCQKQEIQGGSVIHDDAGKQYIKIAYYKHPGMPFSYSVLSTNNGQIIDALYMTFPVGVSGPEQF